MLRPFYSASLRSAIHLKTGSIMGKIGGMLMDYEYEYDYN